ncbi:sorting nexin-14, partial [Plakobranchus ocellatus]
CLRLELKDVINPEIPELLYPFMQFLKSEAAVNVLQFCLACDPTPGSLGSVGDTVACESALRFAGTLPSRVRAPPSAPQPDRGPKSLISPCCGLDIYKNPTLVPLCLD